MNTNYYHVNDPLENFKLRIIVRESARTITGKESSKEVVFHEDLNISWQEKLDGPVDILKRLSKDAPLLIQSNGNIDKDNQGLSDVMLYTYVDKDHFWNGKLPALYDQTVKESYLGAAIFGQSDTNDNTTVNDRETKIQRRITKEKPFKSMHICLATDIDIQKIIEHPRDLSTYMNEHILCMIKLYNDGLLEVTPGFAGVTTESQAGTCMYMDKNMYI